MKRAEGGGGWVAGTLADHQAPAGEGELTDLFVMGSLNAFEASPCTRPRGPKSKFVGDKQ